MLLIKSKGEFKIIDINKPEHFDELNEDKKCALMEFCNSLDKIKSFNYEAFFLWIKTRV